MVYRDATNLDGIIDQIGFNIGYDVANDSNVLKKITGKVNNYYMKATQIIITADGTWKWDDTNQTNQPTATADIVDSQEDYKLLVASPSSGQDWLEIERVEAKDSSGNWMRLRPRDLREIGGAVGEVYKTDATPEFFDFDGASMHLYPNPNYASTGGLKIWFNRAPLEFDYDDTTKRPGFSSLFHEYLVLGPTYEWEKAKQTGNPETTKRDMKEMEFEMAKFYGRRDQTEAKRLTRNYISYK